MVRNLPPNENNEVVLTDIDGTLTPPREPIEPEMVAALHNLNIPFHVAAGSDLPLIRSQFFNPLWEHGYRGEFEAFVSNGASHYHCHYDEEPAIDSVNEFDIRAHLGADGYDLLENTLKEIIDSPSFALGDNVQVMGEQIIDRGSMVNFAPSGRPKSGENLPQEALDNRKAFVAFDKQVGYRPRILEYLKDKLKQLTDEKQLHFMFGGETSFDIVIRGMDKNQRRQ